MPSLCSGWRTVEIVRHPQKPKECLWRWHHWQEQGGQMYEEVYRKGNQHWRQTMKWESISCTPEIFQRGSQSWVQRWCKCLACWDYAVYFTFDLLINDPIKFPPKNVSGSSMNEWMNPSMNPNEITWISSGFLLFNIRLTENITDSQNIWSLQCLLQCHIWQMSPIVVHFLNCTSLEIIPFFYIAICLNIWLYFSAGVPCDPLLWYRFDYGIPSRRETMKAALEVVVSRGGADNGVPRVWRKLDHTTRLAMCATAMSHPRRCSHVASPTSVRIPLCPNMLTTRFVPVPMPLPTSIKP